VALVCLIESSILSKIAWYSFAEHEKEYNHKDVKIEKDGNLTGIHYDMLHTAPPSVAPDFVLKSTLVNEAGWLDVDNHTMQHNSYANIFGLGDVAGLPTAKTGAAIRKQVPVVVDNLGLLINHDKMGNKSYNGYSSCPLVTDYGKMVLAEFDYRYRQLEVEIRKQQGIISLEMGFDNKGNAALVTEQDYFVIFERFSGFLERLSFTIVEIDQERGLITADYNKPESSVWDSIWGEELAELPIEDGQYQILVSRTKDGGTSLTWMDDEGTTLEPGTMNDLQQALENALRQRGIKI